MDLPHAKITGPNMNDASSKGTPRCCECNDYYLSDRHTSREM